MSLYRQIEPDPNLNSIIECYWIVENDEITPKTEKIIPDGFPEIIFHYADPYKIKIGPEWELQSKSLLAGQISNHFFLQNTGRSGMIGIKLHPTAVTRLYGISMDTLTDRVVDLKTILNTETASLAEELRTVDNHERMAGLLNEYFSGLSPEETDTSRLVNEAIRMIFERKGGVAVSELMESLDVGERRLERLFREYVGLTPKFYSRIIRFNAIFRLRQEGMDSWAGLVYEAGYYDQSHFIKNFQEFTGEDPAEYLFEDENMANFFLNRPR